MKRMAKTSALFALLFFVSACCAATSRQAVCHAADTGGVPSTSWKVKAVQLDLARQKETVAFVKGYLARAKACGFNTVVLYLEARIRTPSFPYPKDDACYTADEIAEIVAEAGRLGIDIVPVVSVLGHCEQFLRFRELAHLAEERSDGGGFRNNPAPMTFCHSLPETRKFLERYLDEVIPLFPGKNFHVGLDESFNVGMCSLCRPKMDAVGMGGLYIDCIKWIHGFLGSRGKRMWMWDDFFEFFPEKLEEVARDVVLCNWEYSDYVSPRLGPWGHFGTRFRADWLRRAGLMGFDTIVATGSHKANLTGFTEYAENCPGVYGGLVTQWEMAERFHARGLLRVAAAGAYWNGVRPYGAALDSAVGRFLPQVSGREALAVKALVGGGLRGDALALAVETLRPLRPQDAAIDGNPFSANALVDDLVSEAELALAAERIPAASSAERSRMRRDVELMVLRRERQEDAWRRSCSPGGVGRAAKRVLAKLDGDACGERCVSDGCRLELVLSLPDFHGLPKWTISGCFGGEWRELAKGGWKPNPGEWAYFERAIPFSGRDLPEALRISYRGYGQAGLAYVSVSDGHRRLVPARLSKTSGFVADAENLLVDDVRPARFGDSDCCAQMRDPSRTESESVVELLLKDEFRE